jgi:hypothetical protein
MPIVSTFRALRTVTHQIKPSLPLSFVARSDIHARTIMSDTITKEVMDASELKDGQM